MVVASSLRSICVPTRRKGVFWQWWVISGTHFSFTFSKDEGDTVLKQTRKTSVWGVDRSVLGGRWKIGSGWARYIEEES